MQVVQQSNEVCFYLYFKCEVLLHVFDDHDEERQFDSQSFLLVGRATDVCCAEDKDIHRS